VFLHTDINQIGYLNDEKIGGWAELWTYQIDDGATGHWSPISIQTSNSFSTTDPDEMQEKAIGFMIRVSCSQPWDYSPPVEIEWVTGLWNGREL